METRKINLNMPVEVLDKVDQLANKLGINRTSAIMVLLNDGLEQRAMINAYVLASKNLNVNKE